jgi:FkbM family methyltransferase
MAPLRDRAVRALERRGSTRGITAAHALSTSLLHRDPCWVTREAEGVWRHRQRRGVLYGAGPREPTLRVLEAQAADIYMHRYRPGHGDTVVDVGAGLGAEALVFSRLVGDDGRVLAVEAHPHTFTLLTRTVRANGLDNVSCVHAAASRSSGIAQMSSSPAAQHQLNRVVSQGEAVPAKALDAILEEANADRVDLLKMNIEGAETEALAGAVRTLEVTRNICIGCHDFLADETGDATYRTFDEVRRRLVDAGFSVEERPDDRPWARWYLYGHR